MFDVLDSALFRLLNDYVRNPILDLVLPFFSLTWVLCLLVFLGLTLFFVYCRKQYGEALWRLLALVIVLALSVIVSELGTYLMKDVFERSRPYQNLSGTMYYDFVDDTWVQIRLSGTTESDAIISAKESAVLEEALLVEASTVIEAQTDSTEAIAVTEVQTNSTEAIAVTEVQKNSTEAPLDVSGNAIAEADAEAKAPAFEAQPNSGGDVNAEEQSESASVDVQESQDSDSVPELGYKQALLSDVFTQSSYSMPSAFAASVMAIAFVIGLLFHRASPWVYVFPVLVGWSRIYTGNSYPLDIVVGWIFGILAVAITWFICDFIFRSVSKNRKL